jgi:hypothetical protein
MLNVFLNKFFSPIKLDREKKCIGIINDVQFITHIHAVKCTFEL